MNLRLITSHNKFCKGTPKSIKDSFKRLTSRTFLNMSIFIAHKNADFLPSFPYKSINDVKIDFFPKYFISRSMFEANKIPKSWVKLFNRGIVDEIWVPSIFLVKAYKESKVKKKIIRIPETIDFHIYDPSITTPIPEIRKVSKYNFLSIFKWEARKGPEFLLEAYFTEFKKSEDVCLVLLTFIPGYNYINERQTRKISIESKIHLIISKLKLDHQNIPCYHIIGETFSSSDMPRLYKSADSFVLPSRGEGWGLPYMEAMAMELPTVGTNFGGQLDFMNKDNSFLIDCELEFFDKKLGLKWATPSVSNLKEIMRHLYENSDVGKEKGKIARKFLLENFSQKKVSSYLIQRLKKIEEKELPKRQDFIYSIKKKDFQFTNLYKN